HAEVMLTARADLEQAFKLSGIDKLIALGTFHPEVIRNTGTIRALWLDGELWLAPEEFPHISLSSLRKRLEAAPRSTTQYITGCLQVAARPRRQYLSSSWTAHGASLATAKSAPRLTAESTFRHP